MPFTQRELDQAFEMVCRFHGVPPVEISKEGAPLLGCDIPVEKQARAAFEAARKSRLWP